MFIRKAAGATSTARSAAPTLTKIPVLPISYGDALPLLRAIGGPLAPTDWRGALAIPYHLGPGPARVHLRLEFDWKLAPAYDVQKKWAEANAQIVILAKVLEATSRRSRKPINLGQTLN